MKVQFFAACLLATLATGGRAESAPAAEPPAPPSTPAAQPSELDADIRQLGAEARQVDPAGRLSADQLFQLLQQRQEQRADNEVNPGTVVIPIISISAMLMGFMAWVLGSYRKKRLLHETVRLMVEKGAEIPAGLLAPPPRKPSDLRRGVILSTAGLGLAIFLAVLPDVRGAWGAGLTLFLIGVGHLIVWRLQAGKGRLSSELSPEPQP